MRNRMEFKTRIGLTAAQGRAIENLVTRGSDIEFIRDVLNKMPRPVFENKTLMLHGLRRAVFARRQAFAAQARA